MDPLSQAALGAVTAALVAPRHMTGPVLLVGAVAGALPDIDVLFSVGGDYFDQLVLHRGITHSLAFAPAAGVTLGYLIWWWRSRLRPASAPVEAQHGRASRFNGRAGADESLWAWMLIVGAAVLSHPLLDVFTPYGTQLLMPFSNARFAIDAMPIIDPLFTAILLLGIVVVRRFSHLQHRAAICGVTLTLAAGYIGYAYALNEEAEQIAAEDLRARGVQVLDVRAFPTIAQIHYRRVVAQSLVEGENTPQHVAGNVAPAIANHAGFVSTWHACPIAWGRAVSERGAVVDVLLKTREGAIFSWFAGGFLHFARQATDTGEYLRAADLRYGTTSDPAASLFSIQVPLAVEGGSVRQASGGREIRSTNFPGGLWQAMYPSSCPPDRR